MELKCFNMKSAGRKSIRVKHSETRCVCTPCQQRSSEGTFNESYELLKISIDAHDRFNRVKSRTEVGEEKLNLSYSSLAANRGRYVTRDQPRVRSTRETRAKQK